MTNENVLGWIGYVPQEHILFSKTARENILFGNREATEEELEKAIEIAAFKKDLEFLPEGLETLVERKVFLYQEGKNKGSRLQELLFKIQKF